jgi:hypothetical protein
MRKVTTLSCHDTVVCRGRGSHMGKKFSLGIAVLFVLPFVAATPGPVAAREAESQHVAIPSYFSPGPLWDQMIRARPAVEVAIINPASGPGAASNPGYVAQVQRSQASGLTILGYVHTSYGARPDAEIKAEIDAYATWYHVDGIFFDEASTDCARQGYYAGLTAYARQRTSSHRAVHTALNPGTQTNECYLSVADVIVTFEGDATTYQRSYAAPSWVANYPHSRFWHLVYNVSTAQQMRTIVQLSKERGAGWVYVTPDTLPNPWDTLPTGSYWPGELAAATSNGERGERRADVRAFGATGDGTTDDTAAFTQALASLNEGGTLAVPPGTYRIEPGALTIPGNTAVVGDRATIKPFGTGFDLIELQGTDVGMTGVTIDGENHVVRGVTIVGGAKNARLTRDTFENFTMPTDPADPNYDQTPAGIRIEGNGDTITIEGVTVKNVVANHANDTRDGHPTWVARGIWITPASGQTTSTHITIRDSSLSEVGPKDDGDCIVIQDSTAPADLTIADNTFDRCHKRAIKIQVPGATVTGNQITNPFHGDNPFQVADGGQGAFPYDMYSAIAAYAPDVTIERNTIDGVGSFYAGVEVNASCTVALDRATIRGNTVRMGASADLIGASAIRAFGPATNLTITGNTLAYADTGIVLIPGTPDAVLQGMATSNGFAHVNTKVATRSGC